MRKAIDGRYSVGSDGVVYSNGLPLKAVRGVWVSLHGERRYVSYLVARAFVPNPEGRAYVVHKDGDLEDNRASNLAWSDSPEGGRRRGRKACAVPVVCYTLEGDRLGVYPSIVEASHATGVSASWIRSALRRGRGRRAGNWRWSWVE